MESLGNRLRAVAVVRGGPPPLWLRAVLTLCRRGLAPLALLGRHPGGCPLLKDQSGTSAVCSGIGPLCRRGPRRALRPARVRRAAFGFVGPAPPLLRFAPRGGSLGRLGLSAGRPRPSLGAALPPATPPCGAALGSPGSGLRHGPRSARRPRGAWPCPRSAPGSLRLPCALLGLGPALPSGGGSAGAPPPWRVPLGGPPPWARSRRLFAAWAQSGRRLRPRSSRRGLWAAPLALRRPLPPPPAWGPQPVAPQGVAGFQENMTYRQKGGKNGKI